MASRARVPGAARPSPMGGKPEALRGRLNAHRRQAAPVWRDEGSVSRAAPHEGGHGYGGEGAPGAAASRRVAAQQLLSQCTWLGLKEGERVAVIPQILDRYRDAIRTHLVALWERIGEESAAHGPPPATP